MRYTKLAQRAEKAIKLQVFVIDFLHAVKSHLRNHKGEVINCRIDEQTWTFSNVDDKLMLAIPYKGRQGCDVYTQNPHRVTPGLDRDKGKWYYYMSIGDFLVSEIEKQNLRQEYLEKIFFELII